MLLSFLPSLQVLVSALEELKGCAVRSVLGAVDDEDEACDDVGSDEASRGQFGVHCWHRRP